MSQSIHTDEKNTSKKFKAILAGGLVLGVGATVTLAAWTDQEWATADFSSGSFTLQSSTATILDEESFASQSEEERNELNFEMPQVSQLGPNEQVAAPFSLRLDAETTHDARVTMTAEVERQMAGISYEAFQVASPEQCATDRSTGANTALGAVPKAFPEFTLTANDTDKPGAPYTVCFIVSSNDELPQNQSAMASWGFVADSVTEQN